jgi:hypothetical protein
VFDHRDGEKLARRHVVTVVRYGGSKDQFKTGEQWRGRGPRTGLDLLQHRFRATHFQGK